MKQLVAFSAIVILTACASGPQTDPVFRNDAPVVTQDAGSSGGQPATPTPSATPKGKLLAGKDLYNQMSGFSYKGCYPDGSTFAETTMSDGKTRNDEDGNIVGSWSVSGDTLCYQNDGQEQDVCVKVSKDTKGLHFYLIDSGQYIASTSCPMS